MIDFLKLNVTHLSETELLNNPLIDWKQVVNPITGVLEYPIKGKYFDIDIKINPTRKELTGSIHKLRNEIKTSHNQNYDDFSYSDIESMIRHLIDKFDLVPETTIIENLEIGLNVNTNKSPESILNENLIVWDCKTPSKNNTYDGKGKYLEFATSQFYFKIYDKGKQYEKPENILRVECKIIRNSFLQKYGINTLNDVLNKDHLKRLQAFLFDTFDKCMIVDNISPEHITEPKDKDIFTNGINPFNWISFKNRTQRMRFKDSLFKVLEKYTLNTIQKEIDTKLRAKGNQLLECYEMNDFQNETKETEKGNMLRYEPYIYIHNVTTRKCKTTGIDITHQKSESKFLSMASIKRIFETEPETFKRLLGNFSPKGPETMPFDKLCLEIAHNIRNKDSNKRIEIKRKKITYEMSLFPLSEKEITNR